MLLLPQLARLRHCQPDQLVLGGAAAVALAVIGLSRGEQLQRLQRGAHAERGRVVCFAFLSGAATATTTATVQSLMRTDHLPLVNVMAVVLVRGKEPPLVLLQERDGLGEERGLPFIFIIIVVVFLRTQGAPRGPRVLDSPREVVVVKVGAGVVVVGPRGAATAVLGRVGGAGVGVFGGHLLSFFSLL